MGYVSKVYACLGFPFWTDDRLRYLVAKKGNFDGLYKQLSVI